MTPDLLLIEEMLRDPGSFTMAAMYEQADLLEAHMAATEGQHTERAT